MSVFEQTLALHDYGKMRLALYSLAPSLLVYSAKLTHGALGYYCSATECIVIDRLLDYDVKRCTLVHELAHWVYDDDSFNSRRERAVRTITASALISRERFALFELAYDGNTFLMADELGVTPDIIDDYRQLVLR